MRINFRGSTSPAKSTKINPPRKFLRVRYIHLRLEELFGGDDWFGSINMLFVGDILQLQPVNGSAVFENITKKTLT